MRFTPALKQISCSIILTSLVVASLSCEQETASPKPASAYPAELNTPAKTQQPTNDPTIADQSIPDGPIERIHAFDTPAMIALAIQSKTIEEFATPEDAASQLNNRYFRSARFAASVPDEGFVRTENEFQERRKYEHWTAAFAREQLAVAEADVLVFRWNTRVGDYDFTRKAFPLEMKAGQRQNQRFFELNRESWREKRIPQQRRGLTIELATSVSELPMQEDQAEQLAELMEERGRNTLRVAARLREIKRAQVVFDLGLGRTQSMPSAVFVVEPLRVEVMDEKSGATLYAINVTEGGAETISVIKEAQQRWLKSLGEGETYRFGNLTHNKIATGSRKLSLVPNDVDEIKTVLIDTYRHYRYAGQLKQVSSEPTLDGYHYSFKFERGPKQLIGSMDGRMQNIPIDFYVPVLANDPMPVVFQGTRRLRELLVPESASQSNVQAGLWVDFFAAINAQGADIISGNERLLSDPKNGRIVAFQVGSGGRVFGGEDGQYSHASSLSATVRHAGSARVGDLIVCRLVPAGDAHPKPADQNNIKSSSMRRPGPVVKIEKLWPTDGKSPKFVGWDDP